MAITINGSTNAITGLAAGGLPDGSVDADTLAANAVTTAKIAADAVDGTKVADNAIANEHVAANAIQNAQVADDAIGVAELSTTGTAGSTTFLRGDNAWQAAGGGKIEQAVKCYTASNFSLDNSSFTDITGQSVTVTPAKLGSKFVILQDNQVYLPENSRRANIKVIRNVNSEGWADLTHCQSGPSYEYDAMTDRIRQRGGRVLWDEPSYTTGESIVYKAQCRTSGSIQLNQDGMTGGFVVLEVSS